MRIIIIFFLNCLISFFPLVTKAQDFWEMMTPHKDVSSIAMNSEGHLYIGAKDTITGNGGLYRSMDDGESWELLYHHLYDYKPLTILCTEEYVFFNEQWRLLRMKESAMTFDTVFNEFTQNFLCMEEGVTGTIYTGSTKLFSSTDNGQTWDTLLVFSSTAEYLYDILAVSPDTLFASTVNWLTGGGVYRSVDGGESWEWMLQGFRVTGLEQASNGDVFAAGAGLILENYGQVMVTHDRGENWEESLTMPYLAIQDMTITPEDEIYFGSVGDLYTNKGAYFSNDDGASWNHVPSEIITNTTEVYTIKALSDGYLYACANSSDLYGNVNNLYRSTDTLYTEISRIPQSEELMMVYPNPATQEVTISFEVPAEQAVLQVHNVNGQEMFRQRVTAGRQAMRVEVSSWPQGVYIARVLNKGHLQGAVKFVVR